MAKKSTAPKTTKDVVINTHEDLPTWSARIRAMDSDGHTKSVIAKALGKRYQHVRNVLITPLKKDMEQTAQ